MNEDEPRMMLDADSQCYGCFYYRHIIDCICDHADDEFDKNLGTCDVDCICVGGNMNGYRKNTERK